MTINPPYTRDRKIISEDGKVLTYSNQMRLAEKVMEKLANGEIEPIKTEKIQVGTIKGTRLNINN